MISLQPDTRPVCVHLTSSTRPLRGASLAFPPLHALFWTKRRVLWEVVTWWPTCGPLVTAGSNTVQHTVPLWLVRLHTSQMAQAVIGQWSTFKINVLSHSTALTCFHCDGRPTMYYQCHAIKLLPLSIHFLFYQQYFNVQIKMTFWMQIHVWEVIIISVLGFTSPCCLCCSLLVINHYCTKKRKETRMHTGIRQDASCSSSRRNISEGELKSPWPISLDVKVMSWGYCLLCCPLMSTPVWNKVKELMDKKYKTLERTVEYEAEWSKNQTRKVRSLWVF